MSENEINTVVNIFNDFGDNLNYCVIKCGDSLNSERGSDIDIFCLDIKKTTEVIVRQLNLMIGDEYHIEVKTLHDNQIHIDLLLNKEIVIRFDLYNDLPRYKRILLKASFFGNIVAGRVKRNVNIAGKKISIYTPNIIDDCILRYVEYVEYYLVRPDKVKHMDYIIDKLNTASERESFFEKMNYYTSLPKADLKKRKRSLRDEISDLRIKTNRYTKKELALKVVGKVLRK